MKVMMICVPVGFFALACFLVGVVFWPAIVQNISSRKILGNRNYSVNELRNNTIVFPINKLVTGKYDLHVFFIPYDSVFLQQLQKPINFELTVQIQQGEKSKEKKFRKVFEQGNSPGIFYLFDVPDDFFWSRRANMEIAIKDINFDEEFTQYFDKLSFNILSFTFLAHKINIVDGEYIQRNNGFKNW